MNAFSKVGQICRSICQIIMSTYQIIKSTYQIIMLTSQILMSTCRFCIWQSGVKTWPVHITIWHRNIITIHIQCTFNYLWINDCIRFILVYSSHTWIWVPMKMTQQHLKGTCNRTNNIIVIAVKEMHRLFYVPISLTKPVIVKFNQNISIYFQEQTKYIIKLI